MATGQVRMHQRAVATPVLGRSAHVHDFGKRALGSQTGQQAVGDPGLRVGLFHVAEREQAIRASAGLTGRLSEALVELAPLTPGYVRDKTVEHRAAFLVPIQGQMQKLAQPPAALGYSERVGMLHVSGAGVPAVRGGLFQEGHHVPGGQMAQPHHGGAGSGVLYLVNLARNKSGFHVDVGGVGRAPPVLQAGKGPLFTGNDPLLPIFVVLNGEHRVPILQVIGRIGPVCSIGKVLDLGWCVDLEGDHDLARDLALAGPGLGKPGPQHSRNVWNVVLPAAPNHRISLPHQKPVAGVRRSVRGNLWGAVDVSQGQGLAPVGHVQQNTMIPLGLVYR